MLEQDLLKRLANAPQTIEFEDTMAAIEAYYDFTPTAFEIGNQSNAAGENQGSCKIFAFAQLHDLSAELTPYLFGKYYREDVLKHPDHNDHQNIRNFVEYGWEGVNFEFEALSRKNL